MAKISVYIGRFQPFHLGHAQVLRNALDTSDIVIVLVGSAYQSRTIKNPFSFIERAVMITAWSKIQGKPDPKLMILPLRDQPYNNAKWIQSVQENVDDALKSSVQGSNEITIIGSNRDESTWYLNAFPQYKLKLMKPVSVAGDLSATNLRRRLFSGEKLVQAEWPDVPLTTYKFLQEFEGSAEHQQLIAEYAYLEKYKQAWKAAPYSPTFLTVDTVVIQSGHVLVIERANQPGRGLWALPGGFVNQKETLKEAAVRELIEETGIALQPQTLANLITAKEIFDDPGRSLRGRTVTTAFLLRLDDTKPLPRVSGQNMPLHESGGVPIVETSRAFWLPISVARASSARWFEDHIHIMETMLGLIKD